MLLLLETDAFPKMPAPVFVRGFIRSYAKVVGLDANPIVRAYEQRSAGIEHSVQSTPQPNESARPTTQPAREPRNRVGLNTDRKLTPVEPLSEPREGMFRGGYALLAVFAVGLLIAAWLMVGGKRNMSDATSARVNEPIGMDGFGRELPEGSGSLDGPRASRDGTSTQEGWVTVPPAETRAPPADTLHEPAQPSPSRARPTSASSTVDPSIGPDPHETTARPRASTPRSGERAPARSDAPSGSSNHDNDEE